MLIVSADAKENRITDRQCVFDLSMIETVKKVINMSNIKIAIFRNIGDENQHNRAEDPRLSLRVSISQALKLVSYFFWLFSKTVLLVSIFRHRK